MATIKDFYQGARPKTLSAAVAPVLIGTALAIAQLWKEASRACSDFPGIDCAMPSEIFKHSLPYSVFIACLVVGLAIQVGVNYANDYSDGKKGTDKDRVGPMRLVGSGTASPKSVFIAMVISFFISAVAGLYVASQSSWWLVVVGAVCIALAYLYTGTKFAYGYFGFGELVVFICFGLVATVGTFYALTGRITALSIVGSVIPGLFSVAILLANNIRDIDNDRLSNKKTLPARIGKKAASALFNFSILFIFISIVILGVNYHWAFFALVVSPFIGNLNRRINNAKSPKDYIDVLVNTSKLNLITSIILFISISLPYLVKLKNNG